MQDADQIVADCADLLAHHAVDTAKAREVVVKGMLADHAAAAKSRTALRRTDFGSIARPVLSATSRLTITRDDRTAEFVVETNSRSVGRERRFLIEDRAIGSDTRHR